MGDSVLLLDSGKSLFKGKNKKTNIPLIQARGIAKAYMVMGYDAVAISASDIENGEDFLEETLNEGFPWVSANLVDKNGEPVSKPYVIKTINSLKVAIIGLTETLSPSSKFSILDYAKPLTGLLKQLTSESESDIIILLSNRKRCSKYRSTPKEYPKQPPQLCSVFKRGSLERRFQAQQETGG
ncbi:MAG: 5'-nucleotidase/UDP-sugar diphosphatase, partial [Desulforhopalus sp.]